MRMLLKFTCRLLGFRPQDRVKRASLRAWSYWAIPVLWGGLHTPAVTTPSFAGGIEAVASALGASDVLVLQRHADALRLLGGSGRGAGWAGAVEVQSADEPHVRLAVPGQSPVRLAGSEPVRVIGPYWSTHAALVAAVGDVSSSKLLADELEVVDAVRKLMQYRPETLRDTARHVAEVAGGALS